MNFKIKEAVQAYELKTGKSCKKEVIELFRNGSSDDSANLKYWMRESGKIKSMTAEQIVKFCEITKITPQQLLGIEEMIKV